MSDPGDSRSSGPGASRRRQHFDGATGIALFMAATGFSPFVMKVFETRRAVLMANSDWAAQIDAVSRK
jgi:hypothetical protein